VAQIETEKWHKLKRNLWHSQTEKGGANRRSGIAINHTRQQNRKSHKVYLGKLEIDNNLAENKIRLLALGRKNFLFSGNHAAAQNAAMMHSFMGTCKANDINPRKWLEAALEKLPYCKSQDDYSRLLPQNFREV
jgi:transposase